MENQTIKVDDTVELSNGKTGIVLSVDEERKECSVKILTFDGFQYDRTYSVNHVKVVG